MYVTRACMIDLRPGIEPQMLEVPDGKLSREQVREIVGDEYTVVPTFVSGLVLLLCGEAEEGENALATDMLSVTENCVIHGRALLARVVRNRVTGLPYDRAAYWMQNLKE